MTVKIALDMGLFRALSKPGSGRAESKAQDLASQCVSDVALTRRLLRVLAANEIVSQTSLDTYAPTDFSQILTNDNAASTVSFMNDVCLPCFAQVPAYFCRNGYKNPTGPHNAPWMSCMGTSTGLFGWLHEHPEQLANFGALQAGTQSLVPFWADIYPIEQLMQDFQYTPGDAYNALLVDVGGGTGSDINRFHQRYPQHPGHLILQDLDEVIESAEVDGSIVKMPHDFFTPQPISGALIYFFHNCLHNWPDDEAARILSNLRPALRKGYSRVILHENLILDEHPMPWGTTIDLTMMTLVGAGERTEGAWRQLCESAGYEIVKIWPGMNGATCLIELKRNE